MSWRLSLQDRATRVTLESLANGPGAGDGRSGRPAEVDKDAIRVCGPFEVMSLGRYSVEDWKGYVVREARGIGEAAKLENYIEVICRLYRKDAAIQGATGLVHAVAETEKEKIAISVGPLSGRVTGKQINDAVQDALASGILEVHVLGWAFEANVGEVKSQLEKRGKVKVELIMIRPDTLAEGLKATQPEMLFSPLALPDIEVAVEKNGKEKQLRVTLNGVALFDRKRRTTEYKRRTRATSRRGTSTRTTTATASWTARCSSTSRRRRTSRPRSRPRWTPRSSRSSSTRSRSRCAATSASR